MELRKKIIAIGMTAILFIGMIPMGVMPSVVAAEDNEKPQIQSVEGNTEEWTNGTIELIVTASDMPEENGMGVAAYRMGDNEWKSGLNANVFEISENGIYEFFVKDAVGNVSEAYPVTVDKIDNTTPVIIGVNVYYQGEEEVDWNTYTRSDLEYSFIVNASDEESGIKEYSLDKENWQTENEFRLNGGGNYTFYVRDYAGNIGSTEGTDYILNDDLTNPQIQTIEASIEGENESVVEFDVSGEQAEAVVTKSNSKPTNKEVIFTVKNASDEGSGIDGENRYGTWNEKDKKIDWQSESTFRIMDCQEHYIYVRDNTTPWNESKAYKIQAANFSNEPPAVKGVTGISGQWTNQPVKLFVQADFVFNDAGTEFRITEYKMDDGEWQTANEFEIEDAKEHIFYVKDEAGNISSEGYKTVVDKYDAKIPELKSANTDSIHFKQKNSGKLVKLINTVSFGNFFNERLEITIDAKDEANEISNASGIKGYTLIFQDKDGAEQQFYSTGNTININKEKIENFKGTVYVVLEDNAGNKTERIQVTTANSNLEKVNAWFDGNLMIENDVPVIDGVTPTRKSMQPKDCSIQFQVSDITKKYYSGIANVRVEVNGSEVMNENSTAFTAQKEYSLKVNAKKKTVNGTSVKDWNKGKLNVVISAYDNAGNAAVQKETVFYFEQTAPVIKAFDFNLTSNIETEKNENGYSSVKDAVETTSYGFYFKKAVKVTVSAKDEQYKEEAIASGLRSVTVYLKDSENGNIYIVPKSGAKIKKADSIKEAKELKTKEAISFIVPADFKGQIFAYATDNLGNTPADCVNCTDETVDRQGFVHPNGTLIESAKRHKKTSSIEFTVPKTKSTQNEVYEYVYQGAALQDVKMDYEKTQKVPLYNQDIGFGIKVTDIYSGIREVKWTLIEGKQQITKTITVDNEGTIEGDIAGWKSKKEKNTNLITALEHESLPISGNYNNMVLLVELTDRCGNQSYDYYTFGIDKSAPVIEVEYDNNDAENSYFKAGRKAKVTISERNFNADKVSLTVTRDGMAYDVTPNWKNVKGTGNGDDTKHSFSIDYENEGDYTFHIAYTDRAKNKNQGINYHESVATEQFTVDMTIPQIQVSYDNNNVQNEKYFNQNRTATIVITEHNFDEGRIHLTQTAALGGNPIETPQVFWTNQGDVHTATIAYHTDGDYTFDISMEDMAGNPNTAVDFGNSVAANDFTIDTNIVKPVITGVENGQAYKDEVIPVISFDDVNFNMDEVQLLRTRKNEQNVDVTQKFISGISRESHGGSGASDTFEKKIENDGIYTLNVRMTDMAGNEEAESVTFTVNRFGSVYTYNDYLTSLQDKYVKKVKDDVVITEYNPTRLKTDSLKLQITRDGTPLTNVKYTVNPMVNEYVSVGESGWYQYEYTIASENFKKDGIYKITIASEDAAGNKPETTNFEDGDILFRVDKTPAEVTSIKGLENTVVNAQSQKVEFEVFDAIGLKKIDVYVDGKAVKTFQKFDNITNYNGSFELTEGANQKVRLVIEDIAGNVTDTASESFVPEFAYHDRITVSTNILIRWYANKPIFLGSICGTAAVIGAAGIGLHLRKKKRVK